MVTLVESDAFEMETSELNRIHCSKTVSYGSCDAPTPSTQHNQPTSLAMITLLSLITFGGHSAKSALPVLEIYLIKDDFVSSIGYGILLSAQLLPVMVVPFFIGHLYDNVDHKIITVALLLVSLFGQLLLAMAVSVYSFNLALVAQIISGVGISSIVVAQHALIASNFQVC